MNLNKLMMKYNLTNVQLARPGLPTSTISRMRNGHTPIKKGTLERNMKILVNALIEEKIPAEDLAGLEIKFPRQINLNQEKNYFQEINDHIPPPPEKPPLPEIALNEQDQKKLIAAGFFLIVFDPEHGCIYGRTPEQPFWNTLEYQHDFRNCFRGWNRVRDILKNAKIIYVGINIKELEEVPVANYVENSREFYYRKNRRS